MQDFLTSVPVLPAATMFVVVALATVSLALLWEGVRRYLRSRAAARALRSVMRKEEARSRAPVRTSILAEDPDASVPEWLEPILLKLPHRDDLQTLVDRAASNWSVTTVLLLCVGFAVALGLFGSVLMGGGVTPVILAFAGAYLPIALLKLKATRRMKAFEEHFGESLDLLARAARAGHSLPNGLQLVGEEAEEPVAGEFRQVYEEQRFGLPMQDALLGLADRVDLIDVRIFVTAVLIQRESGGNLAENLDSLSQVIRNRFRFKRDVKTKTAHGRMTGTVVGLAPFVAGIGMYSGNPEYMQPLFEEPLGRVMLVIGAVMMLMGFMVIRRITDIKV